MSALKSVPLSIQAPMDINFSAKIVLGSESVQIPQKKMNSYWIVIVDRSSLKILYNKVITDSDAAPDISGFDKDENMMIVAAIGLGTGYVPQGAFYDFLYQAGAGAGLRRLVQVNQQIGCGEIGWLGYILVGLLGPGRPALPGIEMAEVTYNGAGPVMTVELVPTEISGSVIYTPERVGC